MDSKVIVCADASGSVIVQSKNNPAYGYIRVAQNKVIFNDEGFMSIKSVGALINGLIEDLQSMNWVKGQELEGRVVTRVSLEPFSRKNPERDYKIAGDTGIVCTLKGAPIYHKTTYSKLVEIQDSPEIRHDNGADIIKKQAEMKALLGKGSALKPNTADFKL